MLVSRKAKQKCLETVRKRRSWRFESVPLAELAEFAKREVVGITDEAHRQGMKVWAHSMVFPTRPIEVVRR